MNTNKCTCAYQKLIDRGIHPSDHAWNCPLNKNYKGEVFERLDYRNTDISPFKEEWLRESDRIRYEGQNTENHKIGTEKIRENRRRTLSNKR